MAPKRSRSGRRSGRGGGGGGAGGGNSSKPTAPARRRGRDEVKRFVPTRARGGDTTSPQPSTAPNNDDDDADDDADDEGVAVPGWVLSVIYPALCLLLGPFATCTSLFLVELFEGNCNVTSPLLGELTKSAYAAYLVQPFLISPATWLWTEVLRTQFGDKVYFAPGSSQSTTEVPEGLIWAGLAFSLCFVHALIWPLSAGLRRLPGLRAIL